MDTNDRHLTPGNDARKQEILTTLEKLKKEWNENFPGPESGSCILNEDALSRTLNEHISDTQTQVYKLYRNWFIAGLICSPLAMVIMCVATPYNIRLVGGITLILIFISLLWGCYILQYLKKTDISRMSISQYTYRINRFNQYLIRENITGILLLIPLYLLAFGFNIPKVIFAFAIALTCILLILKKHLKLLKRIRSNLAE